MAVEQSNQEKQHGTSAAYFSGCRCGACRAAVNAYNRERMAKRRAAGVPERRTTPVACARCGVIFAARLDARQAGRGRFCSSDCHNASQSSNGVRVQAREYARMNGPKGSVRRRALRRAREAAAGSSGGKLVWVQGSCIMCGTQYMSRGSASRYCSRSCREKNRSSRSYGLSWLDRMALYARDGWTCRICFEPVDYSADSLSDWYPSLDHVIPRPQGGSDDVSNLRTAHRWCNSVRGDLSYYTDADLAG